MDNAAPAAREAGAPVGEPEPGLVPLGPRLDPGGPVCHVQGVGALLHLAGLVLFGAGGGAVS